MRVSSGMTPLSHRTWRGGDRNAFRVLVAIAAAVVASSAAGQAGGGEGAVDSGEALIRAAHGIVAREFYDPARLEAVGWDAALEPRIAKEFPPNTFRLAYRHDAWVIRDMLKPLDASHTALYIYGEREWADIIDIFLHIPEVRAGARESLTPDGRLEVWSSGFTLKCIGPDHGPPGTYVSEVFPNSAAAEAGLLPGDRFAGPIAIEGGASPTWSWHGEACTLFFERRADAEIDERLSITLQPRLVNPTDEYLKLMTDSARVIEHAPADGGEPVRIGYVRVYSWAGERYRERLREIVLDPDGLLASADGLVLDIRGGWGGASPEDLSLFDNSMPTLTRVTRDGERIEWSPSWAKPVTLLVDGGSRSGKEIIAYAFRKHGIGKVVGTRTAGAVLGGRPFVLSDGSVLYLAVNDVLLDGDVRLEGVGVEPDVVVERELPFSSGRDQQLEKAVEVGAEEVWSARQ